MYELISPGGTRMSPRWGSNTKYIRVLQECRPAGDRNTEYIRRYKNVAPLGLKYKIHSALQECRPAGAQNTEYIRVLQKCRPAGSIRMSLLRKLQELRSLGARIENTFVYKRISLRWRSKTKYNSYDKIAEEAYLKNMNLYSAPEERNSCSKIVSNCIRAPAERHS
jgi:hypothetical protein